ncbi:MAG TPA: hypothetical protein VFA77_01720 [Candidatus Eisenbacteria bacterium]|nr:hypothetical protein [Candidatus Eisenbacteria bacterium]
MGRLLTIIQQNRVTTAVVALVCAIIAFALYNLFSSPLDTQLAAIRTHGYPVTLDELDAWYKHLPPEQNAALVYTKAFALMNVPGTTKVGDLSRTRAWMPKRGQSLAPEFKAELSQLLSTNEAALQLYHSQMSSRSRYPLNFQNGFNMLVPHLSEIRKGVGLLNAEAWEHASNGENDKAVASLLAASRLADSLSEEPIVISQMVRMGCWNSLCVCIERMLAATSFNDEQLATLQSLLAHAERPQSMARALAGERAFGLAIFSSRNPPGLVLGASGPSVGLGERIMRGVAFSAFKLSGILQKDRTFYLTAMETNVAISEMDFPARFNASQQIPANVALPSSRLCIISSMILPALQKTYVRDAENIAHVRVAQTALAVERFRRAHNGSLPKDLAELTPALLSSVPTDPIDGKPLRFKPRGEGFVIYSIGSDAKDDGGAEFNPRASSGTDVTFIVEK